MDKKFTDCEIYSTIATVIVLGFSLFLLDYAVLGKRHVHEERGK